MNIRTLPPKNPLGPPKDEDELWDGDEEATLRRLHASGLSQADIAKEMKTTKNSIAGKIFRLGLGKHRADRAASDVPVKHYAPWHPLRGYSYPRNKENNVTIWLDMDGVLADFNKGYEHLAGFSPIFHHDTLEVDWALVDSFEGFFSALDAMPDAKMLVAYVTTAKPEVEVRVLTSCPKTNPEAVREDKFSWLARRFPALAATVQFVPWTEKKAAFCKPGDILIDDWPGKHRAEWEAAGGTFIWHVRAYDTIRRLRELAAKPVRVAA